MFFCGRRPQTEATLPCGPCPSSGVSVCHRLRTAHLTLTVSAERRRGASCCWLGRLMGGRQKREREGGREEEEEEERWRAGRRQNEAHIYRLGGEGGGISRRLTGCDFPLSRRSPAPLESEERRAERRGPTIQSPVSISRCRPPGVCVCLREEKSVLLCPYLWI